MKNKKVKQQEKENFIPIPCQHCGMPIAFVYEGTQSAKIGCFCSYCDEYSVFDVKIERQNRKKSKAIPYNAMDLSNLKI